VTDVLIAGGGIAGSTLAILLGRRGLSVELHERDSFPREKPCGEGLMPAGVAALERLGIGEAVGGAPFRGVRYHVAGRTIEGRFPRTAGLPAEGRGQRRLVLDRILFEAAAATPGVRAHAGARVEGPLRENGRVVGLVVDGDPRRGRLVVAADGARSRLRRQLGLDLPPRRRRTGVRAHFRLPPGCELSPWVDVYVRRGYELYVTPLPDREILVAGLAEPGALDPPIARTFEGWWRGERDLALRLGDAEQVSDLQGASPLAGRARAGVAPGVVLLGDAAGFADPITGGGMAEALVTAGLLASRVAGGCVDDPGLARFECDRRRLLRDSRMLAALMLWLAQCPALAEKALAGLGRTPGLFSHLVGISAGVRGSLARGGTRRF